MSRLQVTWLLISYSSSIYNPNYSWYVLNGSDWRRLIRAMIVTEQLGCVPPKNKINITYKKLLISLNQAICWIFLQMDSILKYKLILRNL